MFGVELKNFRSLVNHSFDFSRVNILIGENSSGKSSLIKFLLLLERSAELSNISLRLTSNLGRYDDFISGHNKDLDLGFAINLDHDYFSFFLEQFPDEDDSCDELAEYFGRIKNEKKKLKLAFEISNDFQKTNCVKTKFSCDLIGELEIIREPKSKDHVLAGPKCEVRVNSKRFGKNVFKNIKYDQSGYFSLVDGGQIRKRIEEKYENLELFNEIAFLLIGQNYTIEKLGIMTYINPLESTPERVYEENEVQGVLYAVRHIKDVVNILSDETLDEEIRTKLLKRLNAALKKYGILHEIKIDSSLYSARELRVKVKKDDVWCNIKDVGYGSSLQIPIIFQAILGELRDGEIILIEQPEVHIHPFLQAKFIETLLSIGSKNQYIIETHSPDLIRKLQVLVKNNEYDITKDSIAIYYFRKPSKKTIITEHSINEHGKLEPKFPSGFYDSSSNLVKELF